MVNKCACVTRGANLPKVKIEPPTSAAADSGMFWVVRKLMTGDVLGGKNMSCCEGLCVYLMVKRRRGVEDTNVFIDMCVHWEEQTKEQIHKGAP